MPSFLMFSLLLSPLWFVNSEFAEPTPNSQHVSVEKRESMKKFLTKM